MMADQKEMPKTYDPQAFEQQLYDWWEAQGYFKPETQFAKGLASRDQKPFVISMPPPNVTGALHLGHAMTAAVEDLMIRYHRMKGVPTLWVPGTDHAGIATQNVVERQLAQEGLTRHDLGREKFIERVWQWKEEYGARITEQHRRLGVSCDWDRERFTLDEGLSRAVRTAFVTLYKEGLIYRGTYLVNWCPRCESAISDLEVEHQEEDGHLWYVRYPLISDEWDGPRAEWGSGRWAEGATEFIQVATTRPETILGDTAVAVHPEDERYTQTVGHVAVLPAIGRRIPIIADEAVDPEFGTGAVKVTPAHDPTDYEIGQRHGLEQIDVMTDTGKMNEKAGPYAGLDRFVCRERLVADLEKEGLLVKVEPHRHAIGHCQRCGTVIEPRISTQWFVKIKPLAEKAMEAVRDGRIRIIPERFERVYFNWMENIRDWCISRQLWWGHRIPVWYCKDCGGMTCEITDPTECAHCGSKNIEQDPDVLDTWFSSGLWPFSTLGWPEETEDYKYFYPTSVLETAYDILFFWVARMIMMGLHFTDKPPFEVVYLHGLIRDAQGRKMSKSLGNALDPVELINEYGCDALRFTLMTSSTPGNDIKLDEKKVEGARNFANKVWNAARFVITNLDDTAPVAEMSPDEPGLTLADRWIISRYHRLVSEVTDMMESYQYGEAGRRIYEFLWGEFCDWFIEIAKIRLYGEDDFARETVRRVLVYVLEHTLRLLHPFMPFVTEAIWQQVPHEGEALIIARWPEPGPTDETAEAQMGLVQEIVRGIRNARAEYDVQPGRRIAALINAGDALDLLQSQRDVLAMLARLDPEQLTIEESIPAPKQAVTIVAGQATVYLPLAGMVDLDAERERLNKAMESVRKDIARSEKLLSNEGFRNKAPAEVIAREEAKLAELKSRLTRLKERLALLG
ncbi:MAG: valine--tRNA ligase [Anaerolineae bacterium]|nr:valine--tRNA ligase [Anaerolineae bacterium]